MDKILLAAGIETLSGSPDTGAISQFLRNLAAAAEALTDPEREALRAVAIRELSEIGIKAPMRLVGQAIKRTKPETNVAGSALKFPDPEPWPNPVDGAALLDSLRGLFRMYLILPKFGGALAALWALYTWVFDCFTISPILGIWSPEKRCAKTTLLEILLCVVAKPLPASHLSAAVLYRIVEGEAPTLLVDEADTFLKRNDDLRGVLNGGWRRPFASVPRCSGDDYEVRSFSSWAPKAIACIGTLPDTLRDRSLGLRMKRKSPRERVERFRFDFVHVATREIRRKAARWARDSEKGLRRALPNLPDIPSDRARDNWAPLLAIADMAGGEWPELARRAAVELSGGAERDDSARVRLLADIRRVFAESNDDPLRSAALCAALARIEESPWAEWRKGKPISQVQLAALLKPFEISPQQIWDSRAGKKIRGYEPEMFDDAFERYLDAEASSKLEPSQDKAVDPVEPNDDGAYSDDANPVDGAGSTGLKDSAKPNGDGDSTGSTGSEPKSEPALPPGWKQIGPGLFQGPGWKVGTR